MLTEKEAKEKWCPFARVFMGDWPQKTTGSACNRIMTTEPEEGQTSADNYILDNDNKCIGSDCMAWRWRRRYENDDRDEKISHCTGYCGLAGKP